MNTSELKARLESAMNIETGLKAQVMFLVEEAGMSLGEWFARMEAIQADVPFVGHITTEELVTGMPNRGFRTRVLAELSGKSLIEANGVLRGVDVSQHPMALAQALGKAFGIRLYHEMFADAY